MVYKCVLRLSIQYITYEYGEGAGMRTIGLFCLLLVQKLFIFKPTLRENISELISREL